MFKVYIFEQWDTLAQAAFVIIVFILTVVAFPSQPKHAPSLADSKKRVSIISIRSMGSIGESYGQKLCGLLKTLRGRVPKNSKKSKS